MSNSNNSSNLFEQPDSEALLVVYEQDSILSRLRQDKVDADAAFAESHRRLAELAAEKRRLQRAVEEARSKSNRTNRRIKSRERALVERFMSDKLIWLRKKLGIKPVSV